MQKTTTSEKLANLKVAVLISKTNVVNKLLRKRHNAGCV